MTVNVHQSLFEVPIPAAVAQAPLQEPPKCSDALVRQRSFRTAAMIATGLSFVVPAPGDIRSWVNYNLPVQSPQPTQPGRERGIALIPAVLDTPAPQINFLPHGCSAQEVQPPAFQRSQAFLEISWRFDQHSTAPTPRNWGFEIATPPTMRATQYRGTTRSPGPANVEAPFGFLPFGWEIATPQPPHPRPEKSGVAHTGDSGAAAPQIPFCFYGWETKLGQLSVSGCSPVFTGDSWRLDQASVGAVPLNWGFEPFPLPLQRGQNGGSAADLGSEIKAVLPVILTPNDTVRPERLLSSPGRARLLATPGKVRDLQA